MKKVLFMLAFAGFAMAANAQFILGGQLGLSTGSSNTHHEKIGALADFDQPTSSSFDFTFAPTISYVLNEKMQVGVGLSLTLGSNTMYGPAAVYALDKEMWSKTSSTSFGVSPYFRYYFAKAGKFNFFCEAALGLFINSRDKIHDFDNTVTPNYDKEYNGATSSTQFVVSIVPGVNYKINDKWSADCYIDLAGIAFVHSATKNYGVGSDPDKLASTDAVNYFGLMANAGAQTIDSHFDNFRIGFNYHF